MGYSPRSGKELDTTEQLTFFPSHFHGNSTFNCFVELPYCFSQQLCHFTFLLIIWEGSIASSFISDENHLHFFHSFNVLLCQSFPPSKIVSEYAFRVFAILSHQEVYH